MLSHTHTLTLFLFFWSQEVSKEDKESATTVVAEDRKHAVDAAIVRIMKMRKTLELQKLILETSQQLLRLFKPDVT